MNQIMRAKQISIISCLILSLAVSNTLSAQDTTALKANKTRAVTVFLDKASPRSERLAALQRMGYPDDATFSRFITLAKDKTEDTLIRLRALKIHPYDEAYFNTVMAILSDPTETSTLKTSLIKDIGQRTTFRMPSQMRQTLQATLRALLDDAAESVRIAAYRTLVPAHDAVAIDKLVEGLRSNNFPIPLEEAIELLDVDGSAKHLTTLRPFLNHPNLKAQAQAARALAIDPQSRQRVVQLATSNSTNQDIRKHALRGLAREDNNFMQYAIRIIINPEESADIRYEAMKNGMGRLNYHKERDTVQIQYAQAIERVSQGRPARTSQGKELTAEAKQLLPHLRRNFPAIGRYYKFRR